MKCDFCEDHSMVKYPDGLCELCRNRMSELGFVRLKPGQVVAEWVSCPCCAPPEKHCAFCMGVNKILVEEGK
jgi:hypothetical protein